MVNVGVSQKKPLSELPSVTEAVAEVESKLGGRGRVLIRYSGTELKARVMVEGESQDEVQEYVDYLASVLKQALAQ
jgi:phosphoglucosamine mutase